MIHHSVVPRVSTPTRMATPTRRAADGGRGDSTSHSSGPRPARRSDDALTEPTVRATSAMAAGSRQRPRRSARSVSPINHGSPAQGSSRTEMRAVYASWYGARP